MVRRAIASGVNALSDALLQLRKRRSIRDGGKGTCMKRAELRVRIGRRRDTRRRLPGVIVALVRRVGLCAAGLSRAVLAAARDDV